MDKLTEIYVKAENTLATMADAEDGATAVEYGLMVALIAGAIVAVVALLGGKISSAFSTIASKL